jgi:hypothetical protein
MRPFAADVVDTLCGEASRDAEKQLLQFCADVLLDTEMGYVMFPN